MGLVYKIARTKEEFEKIHELNYKTFVEEIPQHDKNNERKLIDPFHLENTYLICMKDSELIGMISVRGKRPFSLDKKLGTIEDYLPFTSRNICEIRLLAVEQEYRNGRVFLGLAQLLARYCLKEGYDTAVISGTTRQEKLYSQLGFKSFAHLTGTGDALFQPMYLTKETFEEVLAGRIAVEPLSFLPGPVLVPTNVKEMLYASPISHRSSDFSQKMDLVQQKLCSMTSSRFVQVLVGTGTLANDVVAAQLSLLEGKGLIIVGGEFGSRLVDHAERAGLSFDKIELGWGEPITKETLYRKIPENSYTWMWAVHCETSAGTLANIEELKSVCQTYNIKLCLDCISSLGTMAIDLRGVYLASSVSGKAIGSYTGLSFVFHQHVVYPAKSIPRYLDLGLYTKNDSVPFSHSSNLLEALLQALSKFDDIKIYEEITRRYNFIRKEVEDFELRVLTELENSTNAIMTIVVPENISSKQLGDDMYLQGYQLHYESSYLIEKNWIQIACISDISDRDIGKMLRSLKALVRIHENNTLFQI